MEQKLQLKLIINKITTFNNWILIAKNRGHVKYKIRKFKNHKIRFFDLQGGP